MAKSEVEQAKVETLEALLGVLAAKSTDLKRDAERAHWLCERMARYLGLTPVQAEEIKIAGLLHDIGMIHTPDSILEKTGPLTPDEYAIIKSHATVGAAILAPLSHLGRAVEYTRYHHERLDGSGYPERLKNDEIPLGAQIVGVADAYTALTADRPHRPSVSRTEALQILWAGENTWFCTRVLEALEWAVLASTKASPAS